MMKPISVGLLDVLDKLNADIIVLNEYMDRGKRDEFRSDLANIGYACVSVSPDLGRHNQVLIASKEPHVKGDIAPPVFDDSSITNFHHVHVPTLDIEVVGLRAPAYKKKSDLAQYWSQLRLVIESAANRKILFIGDFNCDPALPKYVGSRHLIELVEAGWQLPVAAGSWSYISHDGTRQIMLLFRSAWVSLEVATYIR